MEKQKRFQGQSEITGTCSTFLELGLVWFASNTMAVRSSPALLSVCRRPIKKKKRKGGNVEGPRLIHIPHYASAAEPQPGRGGTRRSTGASRGRCPSASRPDPERERQQKALRQQGRSAKPPRLPLPCSPLPSRLPQAKRFCNRPLRAVWESHCSCL